MKATIEDLSCKIAEGFQALPLSNADQRLNVFHRRIATFESSDLSFITGLISTGLRGAAWLDGANLINNLDQLLTASREHLALVVNTSARTVGDSTYSTINNYHSINVIRETGCFQLVANSLREQVYLTLIAHRIAELSLIPGIVIADYTAIDEHINFPPDHLIREYLGDPDDHIICPSPAQTMIFGKTRRRIPNWFSLDLPVMLGSKKNSKALSFEGAATEKYFYDHLPQLMEQAYREFNEIFGVGIKPVVSKGRSSDFAIIVMGGQLTDQFDEILQDTKKVELIRINQVQPFPTDQVAVLTKGKKSITILENISGWGLPHSIFYYNVLNALEGRKIKIYSGKYRADVDTTSLSMAIDHMISNQSKADYFLGIQFSKSSSSYPKHEVLLQEIEKQYPGITADCISSHKSKGHTASASLDVIPQSVRMHRDMGPNYAQLSRFYDQTAFFYEHNCQNELVADPFSALPITPASSANFFNQSSERKLLPHFHPEKCTGCGDCFVYCPHSALPPIAIGIQQLMQTGADMAAAKGKVISRLIPMLKHFEKVSIQIIQNTNVTSPHDFLPSVFESLAIQMKMEGEKLETARNEFKAVMHEIAKFPISINDHFYNKPTSIEPGSGELFSLTVNPIACTGCSLCVQICPEEALTMQPQEEVNDVEVHEQFRLWEQLPDTAGYTIQRLHHEKDYNSLAAILLSRNYYMTMTGANQLENNSSYKTLLHIVTATAESVVQPKVIGQLSRIDELIDSLSENVHKKLSDALPNRDLDRLSNSLEKTRRRKIHMRDLVNHLDEDYRGKLIDSEDLKRKTALIKDLSNLRWILSEGPTGVGRARYGLLLASSNALEWANQYPTNNFSSPCVISWNGSAPEQTLGLFYGQLRYTLDHIKLLRRAELECKDKYDPGQHDLSIAELSWDNLTDKEKQLIPPILLVVEREDLNSSGWSSLNRLLAEKYPVKIFLFDHVASPYKSPEIAFSQTSSGLISAIALKNAFVFQGGNGNTAHLFHGLVEGLDKSYPALFNLYATQYQKHVTASIDWSPYASLALNSRAFPSLYYDPRENNLFLRGAINLKGNRDTHQNWVEEEIVISNQEKVKYEISWADWAYTQSDWKNQFTPIENNQSKMLLPEYIGLNEVERKDHVPVIMRAGEDGLKYYSVSSRVVEMTEAVLINWNTLRELAGILTEFPMKLRAEVTKELSTNYEEKAAALSKKYEQQLKDLEAAQTEILRQRLKEKLMALSSMAQTKDKD